MEITTQAPVDSIGAVEGQRPLTIREVRGPSGSDQRSAYWTLVFTDESNAAPMKVNFQEDEDARHVREDNGWMCPICRSCYSLDDGVRYLTRSQTCGCPDMPEKVRELRVARHMEVPEGPNTRLVNVDPEINTVAILMYQCVTGKRFGYLWGTEMNVWVHRAQFIVGALRAKEYLEP